MLPDAARDLSVSELLHALSEKLNLECTTLQKRRLSVAEMELEVSER